jgi:hypothetical protein
MYIARPLLWRKHYPDGAQHLVSLLQLSLPGIDPNDPIKTDSTFKFYCSILANVPLVDCSNVPADAEVCAPRVLLGGRRKCGWDGATRLSCFLRAA